MEKLLKNTIMLGFAVKELQEMDEVYEINIDHNTGMPRIAVHEELFNSINANEIYVTRKHDDYFQEKHKIFHKVIFVTYADKKENHAKNDEVTKMNMFTDSLTQKEAV